MKVSQKNVIVFIKLEKDFLVFGQMGNDCRVSFKIAETICKDFNYLNGFWKGKKVIVCYFRLPQTINAKCCLPLNIHSRQ